MADRSAPFLIAAGGLGVWTLVSGACRAATPKIPPALKRSDVVFRGQSWVGPKLYRTYGTSRIAWAGRPFTDDPKQIERFRRWIEPAHKLGIRWSASICFVTQLYPFIDADERFLETVCVDLSGKRITAPWLWDHRHKGHPYYWCCSNSPRYRQFLRDNKTRLAACFGADGLHIDGAQGSAGAIRLGGCFCQHCMAGFREFLKQNASPDRLKQFGIEDLDHFDYGTFLRERGVTVGDFNKSWRDIPLADEFQVCQHKAAAALVRELGDHAERLLGRPLIRSVNIPVTEPLSFLFAPHVSYFCAEVGQYARYDRPMANTVFVYKVADALGKGLACMAHGGEWAYIAEHKLPGLVRTWIAQAYAFGQCFMCPVSQWATNKKKGSHIYSSKPEEYAHLYQFVRQHAVLFDDYDEAANVAVVYSTRAYRLGYRDALRASIWLTARNVGHHVVIAGDEAGTKVTVPRLALWAIVTLE